MYKPEQWKDVPEWESAYEVSDVGRVRNKRNGRILKPWKHVAGYDLVTLALDRFKKKFTVHCLVLTAFVGPKPRGTECCHGNGIPDDNRLSNLRWDTKEGNRKDNFRLNRYARGENHSQARLSVDAVRRIRLMAPTHTYAQISRIENIPAYLVRRVAIGQTYKQEA